MASKPYILITGLPLLFPFFARCMPPPWEAHNQFLRRQLDPAATMRTTVIVAETSTIYTTFTTTLDLSSPLPSHSTNSAADERSGPILVFPGEMLPLPSYPPFSSTPQETVTASQPSASLPTQPSLSPNLSARPGAPDPKQTPLVMAYYPDWVIDDFPPERIDFGRFDWIDFAFTVPEKNFQLSWDGSDDAPDALRRLVDRAHQSGKRVKLSVGGWTGSKYFSSAVADSQGRVTLANNMLTMYDRYGLDGIDIDWEYPSQDGDGGNLESPDDSANFLDFLRTLRNTLPPNATITAATQTVPFADANGKPMQNVSEFARVLDWVLLMNYDTWGSSSRPGPNAPLSNACNNSTQSNANALSALQLWTAAGFAPRQLVLGVPSYGYISRSSEKLLQTRASRSGRRRTRKRKSRNRRGRRAAMLDWAEAVAGMLPGAMRVKNDDGGTDGGQVQFRELVSQGVIQPYLSGITPSTSATQLGSTGTTGTGGNLGSMNDTAVSSGSSESSGPSSSNSSSGSGYDSGRSDPAAATPYAERFSALASAAFLRGAIENGERRRLFAGDGGFVRMWDGCSSTPYLRSEGARQIVTYDDPVSLEMKAQLVRQAGMRGVNLFDVHGDTDGWDLTEALRRGLGLV